MERKKPVPKLLIPPTTNKKEDIRYTWGRYRDEEFQENVSFVCEQVVHWKRNLFLLPASKVGKLHVEVLYIKISQRLDR